MWSRAYSGYQNKSKMKQLIAHKTGLNTLLINRFQVQVRGGSHQLYNPKSVSKLSYFTTILLCYLWVELQQKIGRPILLFKSMPNFCTFYKKEDATICGRGIQSNNYLFVILAEFVKFPSSYAFRVYIPIKNNTHTIQF